MKKIKFCSISNIVPEFRYIVSFLLFTQIVYSQNVGIGTNTPNNKLEIKSSAANTSGLRFTNLTSASPTITANGKSLSVDANGDVILTPSSADAWSIFGNTGTTAGTNFLGTTDVQDLVFKTNSTEWMRILSGGNVGIGSNSPTNKLTIGTNDGSGFGISTNIGTPYGINAITSEAISSSNPAIWVRTTTDGGSTFKPLFRVQNDGNVGIGINLPKDVLNVNGGVLIHGFSGSNGLTVSRDNTLVGVGAPRFRVIPDASRNFIFSENGPLYFNVSGITDVAIDVTGNVGVGTTAPSSKLHIVGVGSTVSNNGLMIQSPNAIQSLDVMPGYALNGTAAGIQEDLTMTIRSSGTTPGNIAFATGNIEHMRLTSIGNLGLGTTAPAEKLHLVNGQIRIDGTSNANTNNAFIRFNLNNGTPSSWIGDGASGDNDLYVYSYNDNVRIGTGLVSTAANSLYFNQAGNFGVGNINPNNKLEITSAAANTSGLRFTNLTSTSTTVAANGKALTVDANGDVVLAPSSANAWSIVGNAGTTAGTNFLGTTDPQDLVIKTNNIEKVRVLNNGNVGIGTSIPGQLLQVEKTINGDADIGVWNPNTIDNSAREILILGQAFGGKYGFLSHHNDGYANPAYPKLSPNSTLLASGVDADLILATGDPLGDIRMGSSLLNLEYVTIKGNTGNIGVKTINPITSLSNTDLNISGADGNGITQPSITWAMNSAGYVQALYNQGTSSNSNGLAVKIAGTAATNRIFDLSVGAVQTTAGTSVMTVLGTGNVGIGAINPNSNLHVKSAGNTRITVEGDNLGYTNADVFLKANGTGQYRGLGIYMQDAPSNITWYSGRNYGGTIGSNDYFMINRYSGATPEVAAGLYDGSNVPTGTTNFFTIDNTGNVGIETTNPLTQLHVAGTHPGASSGTGVANDAPTQAIIPAGSNGTSRLSDWPAGWGGGLSTHDIAGSSTFFSAYVTRSDRKLKRNITDMDSELVKNVLKLHPVTYYLKEQTPENEGLQYGFIAQEVRELFPSIVTKTNDEENGTIGMNYQALIAPTIYVVQKQQQEILDLKNQLQIQQQKLEELTKKLNSLPSTK